MKWQSLRGRQPRTPISCLWDTVHTVNICIIHIRIHTPEFSLQYESLDVVSSLLYNIVLLTPSVFSYECIGYFGDWAVGQTWEDQEFILAISGAQNKLHHILFQELGSRNKIFGQSLSEARTRVQIAWIRIMKVIKKYLRAQYVLEKRCFPKTQFFKTLLK
jgi:hypothetical protein